jgi:hypothetical protein
VIPRRLVLVLPILALAACSATPPVTPPVTPSASSVERPFDAEAVLAASSSGIDSGAYAFYFSRPEGAFHGKLHTPSGTEDFTAEREQNGISVRSRFLITGDRRYAKVQVSGGKWDKGLAELEALEANPDGVDRKQIRRLRELYDFATGEFWMPPTPVPPRGPGQPDLRDADAFGLKRLLTRVKTVEGSPAVLTGTIDLSDLGDDATMLGSMTRQLPPSGNVTAVPFRATLDNKDRIHKLDMTLPGKENVWSVNMQEAYDFVQAQTAPDPREIKKPSRAVLKLLAQADRGVSV